MIFLTQEITIFTNRWIFLQIERKHKTKWLARWVGLGRFVASQAALLEVREVLRPERKK